MDTENNLLIFNPKLAWEWHSTSNGSLTPRDVRPFSNKKVWWKCSKGHEWVATVSNRSNGQGCPYCANQKVNAENCLQTVNPDLASQWHPSLNGSLTPMDVTAGSNKKVWWQCARKHKWQTTVNNRSNNHGCPYCYRIDGIIDKKRKMKSNNV
ncbi:MAG: zinc-ribbon domain-containing protein [Deltaproteobacteria bacterium]|nr:zinc-ribbon domain-containing protein [Deltaproteobacteria bacterium]